jgi:hypothetical protein
VRSVRVTNPVAPILPERSIDCRGPCFDELMANKFSEPKIRLNCSKKAANLAADSAEWGPAVQIRSAPHSSPSRVETSGESFEKPCIEAGFWHSGGSRERADLAVLVRSSTKLSGDDFRGPHLDPARARVLGSRKGERLRRLANLAEYEPVGHLFRLIYLGSSEFA